MEIVGVVINKILPEKYEFIKDFCTRGLARLGIELVGAMPREPILSSPTLNEICKQVRGRFVNSRSEAHRKVERSIIGAMNSSHVMEEFTPGTLVVTPGDREDIILAALSTTALLEPQRKGLTGLVLSGDLLPHPTVLNLIAQSALPVIASPMDTYSVASAIHTMTIKTMPGDYEKIHRIQSMVEKYINVDRILEKIG